MPSIYTLNTHLASLFLRYTSVLIALKFFLLSSSLFEMPTGAITSTLAYMMVKLYSTKPSKQYENYLLTDSCKFCFFEINHCFSYLFSFKYIPLFDKSNCFAIGD
ncbi:uncharacterized protein B0P05DRAFT_541145 [Gilbertella persicaria]|uniref:uncharacterized protein n=1 Tax=Gilbertella persicaria TaxID=101096 RepID=UPI00221F348E|nr:uncharacterized protein B0P05DRAFT_541145 [Gilbertella persicaria]KAI8079571.1 hypothetical protein B0P05DRAFT_541145 [Gilbertella persicaria]